MSVTVKEPWELALLRNSGRRLAEVVSLLEEATVVGVSTLELDALAEREIRNRGARPAFKGYAPGGAPPFPATICASVNEEVVHGIPDDRCLMEGDLVSIDVGLVFGGYYADCAFTKYLGDDPDMVRILDVTRESLYEGIAMAIAGNRIGDLGHAIQSYVEPHGFGIVREFVGHGVGRKLHEPPSVPNYGKPRRGPLLKPGMVLAIEPMVTRGTHETDLLSDGWTVVTRDRKPAAHFEHTIAVTPRGPEILTTLDSVA